jgi:hypothetical protein
MATNQSFRRLERLILTLAIASATVLPSRAGDWMPLLPDQNFYDFQLFAPPDLQDYEIYPEPSEGIFFNYDRLYWGITPPNVRGVGQTDKGGYLIPNQPISPQAIVQLNNASIQASGTSGGPNVIGGLYIYGSDPLQLDLNTSWMRTKMAWGNRYEGGWIYDGRGVNISYFTIGSQSQEFQTISEFAASSPTQIFTQQVTGGGNNTGGGAAVNNSFPLSTTTITANSPPPDHLIAQKFTQLNSTEIESAGAAAIIRRELGGRGSRSTARFSFGPRFLQFADRYRLGYESNQYAFNQGPTAGTQGSGVNISGGGGGTTGGGTGGGGTGGGGTGGGGTGGAGGTGQQGTNNAFGNNTSLYTSSAGDVIGITGVDTLTGLGQSSPLQVGAWETDSFNNMVGPEFGLLLESQTGRWKFSSEFKVTAAFNWQNNLYRGSNFPDSIGADYLRATFNPSNTFPSSGITTGTTATPITAPPLFLQLYGVGQQNTTNAAEHRFVFSPIGEWRFGAEFKVSQAITLHAGYTGMWLGSIARASTNTGYRSVEKATKYAEPQNPNTTAAITNPWVVKTTGAPPPGSTQVVGSSPTDTNAVFKDAQGNYYNGNNNPYQRQNPVYNRIGAVDGGQEYVFTNGVDFGITVRY